MLPRRPWLLALEPPSPVPGIIVSVPFGEGQSEGHIFSGEGRGMGGQPQVLRPPSESCSGQPGTRPGNSLNVSFLVREIGAEVHIRGCVKGPAHSWGSIYDGGS